MKKTTFGKLLKKATLRGVNIYFESDAQLWEATPSEFKKSQAVYYEDNGDGLEIIFPRIEYITTSINGADYTIKKFVELVEL